MPGKRPRQQHLRDSCVYGHSYEEGTFRVTTTGFRVCLICDRVNQKRYRNKVSNRTGVTPVRKRCSKCSQVLDATAFTRRRDSLDGLAYLCKSCIRASARKSQYGLSAEDFDRMVEEQNGKCLICMDSTSLVVDHCHDSGQVRGLLCRGCNAALGLFRDDTEILSRAISYLQAVREMDVRLAGKVV